MRIPYESKNTVIAKTPPTTVKPVTSRVVEVLRDEREIEVINGKEVEVIAVEAVVWESNSARQLALKSSALVARLNIIFVVFVISSLLL